jgi:hypothetical protein
MKKALFLALAVMFIACLPAARVCAEDAYDGMNDVPDYGKGYDSEGSSTVDAGTDSSSAAADDNPSGGSTGSYDENGGYHSN